MANRARALVIDDVVDMAQTVANELEAAGFETEVCSTAGAALKRFSLAPPDVVVTDLRMKNMDGLDVLSEVRRMDPSVPVIIMTAFGGVESAVEAMRRGAFDYITKPFAMETIRALVERACRERALPRESSESRRAPRTTATSQLLGDGQPMRNLRTLIERVSAASSPVLISGETGTGKEMVALAIHADSPRASKPFVAVNCAALPDHLLESELFGHAKGAFTGASQARRGLFLEADGGTMLLDEIGDLPLPLQGKLLRVLQSGEVRPVGLEASRTVDVRCLAATHKDLPSLVEQGLFRQDLFFRLDVLRVPVPALDERREDIPLLLEHFLERSRANFASPVLAGFDPLAMDFLLEHPWPGNVRQLQNLVERLVVTATSRLASLAEVKVAIGPSRQPDPMGPLLEEPLTLEELSARYIAAILKKVGGSKIKAAEILGVDPSTVYRRDKTR